MSRLLMPLLLAPHGSAGAEFRRPTAAPINCSSASTISSTHPHCISNIELQPHMVAPQLICVDNRPLSAHFIFGGALLRLFDVQTIVIGGDDIRRVEVHYGSDDTFLTGAFSNMSAVDQVRLAFSPDGASPLHSQLDKLWRALAQAWHEGRNVRERRISFSPFYASCVGLQLASGSAAANVTVKWYREGPLGSLSASRLFSGGGGGGGSGAAGMADPHARAPLRLWSGLALFACGALLFVYSSTFAESVVFHYASGVSLSMVFGVLLIALIVWHRMGRRRPSLVVASLLSLIGVTATALREWAQQYLLEMGLRHWPYVLGYLGFFGCVGYGLTFWRLRGGRPEAYECALLARAMQLVALILVCQSSHSLRASSSLVVGLVSFAGMPSFVTRPVVHQGKAIWRRISERNPAPAVREYKDEDGARRTWRPATASGAYMSEEQYREQGEIATAAGMGELMKSPEFARWLAQNHARVNVAVRQPSFDGGEDVSD